MSSPSLYQVHIFLKEEFAAAAARHETPAGMELLMDVLERHNAVLAHSRLEEFSEFVRKIERLPQAKTSATIRNLCALTTTALSDPEKCSLFAREFTLSMNGKLMFSGTAADALIADLKNIGDDCVLTNGKVADPGRALRSVPSVRKVYLPRHHPGT